MSSSTEPVAVAVPKYFRMERVFLKYGGIPVDGSESLASKVYSFIVFCLFVVPFPLTILINLIIQGNFHEVIVLWIFGLGFTMDSFIATDVYFRRKQLAKILNELEDEIFMPDINRHSLEEEENLLNNWSFSYKSQRVLFVIGCLISITIPMVVTLIKRLMSSDYRDWKLAWGTTTFINVTYSPNFEIVWLYQNIGMIYICVTMVPIFLIMFGTLSFISVQFKILHIYLRKLATFSDEESSENKPLILINMERAINYHLYITNLAKEIETFFHRPFLFVFMTILSLVCLEVYRASLISLRDSSFLMILTETLTLYSLVIGICYYGEEIAFNSQEVGNLAYQMDFVGTDLRFQKNIIFVIRRSQNVIRMKAGGLIEISMETMVWILRTAFSAFMMLRTVNAPEASE